MSSSTAFSGATAVRPDGAGRYAVDVDPGWSVGDRPNGGYLMSLVGRAALAASPHPDLLAMSASFLRPPAFGPAVVDLATLRAGRSVAMHRTDLVEGAGSVLTALVTSGRLPEEDPSYDDAPPPALPALEDCPRAPADTPIGTRVGLMDHVDVRFDPSSVQWAVGGAGGTPEVRAWVRPADGSPADPLFLLTAVDALPPTVFALGMFGWAPTVELTCLVRGRPAPGWLRVRARTRLVAGGWFDEDAAVWDSAGRLVAESRQLAMVGRVAGRVGGRVG